MAQSYANFEDFMVFGLPGRNIGSAPEVDIHLAAASRIADSYIPSRYSPPLEQWPQSLTIAVCRIAALQYLGTQGFDVEGPDVIVKELHDSAIAWLKDVATGKASLIGVPAENTTPKPGPRTLPRVSSDEPRGL